MPRNSLVVNHLTQPILFLILSLYSVSPHAQIEVPPYASQPIINENNKNKDNNSIDNNNNSEPVTYFDPIVVTATRSQKRLSDSPITMQLLDRQTLQDNHAHTLKQALDLLPNVYLSQLHGKTGYEVRMQGFSGDQVLVLIDGLPITASTGSAVNLSQYLNTSVEQVEVIQGAASAQYGSSAMGGVINVITKPITDSHALITVELGSNGSQNPSGDSTDNNTSFVEGSIEGAVSKDERIKARLSGSYLDDNGLSVDTKAWSQLKDASTQKQITAKLSFTPDIADVQKNFPATQYWIEAGYYEEDDMSRFGYYAPPRNLNQQKDEKIERKRLSMGGYTKFDAKLASPNNLYKFAGSVLFEDYESESDTTSSNILISARTTGITTNSGQVQLDLPFIYRGQEQNQSHAIQLGGKWQQDKLTQQKNNISELVSDDVSRDVIEAYIQDDWMFGLGSEIVAGVRYQDDTDFGSHIAPKIAFMQEIYNNNNQKHVFRASVGTGYRVPNLKERYYVFDHSNFGYKVLGNPNLSPETSTSYQMGYQTDLSDDLSLTLNGFYNKIEDLIQTDRANPTYNNSVAIYHYDNIDNATTYGADIAINWVVNPKTNINIAYANLQTKNDETGAGLNHSPEHKVTANVDYQLYDNIQLVQQFTYESKQLVDATKQRYSPQWLLWDSRVNYTATPNLDLYMAVNNVLDEQRDANDADDQRPVDNRQWLVGANYHW